VPTATFVKIDEVKERKVGTDIDAIKSGKKTTTTTRVAVVVNGP
jgi:hypothetical protein